jgi:hypothetical protein
MKTYEHHGFEINVSFANGETAFIAEDAKIGGLYSDTSTGDNDELVSLLRYVADEIEKQDPRASVP